MDGVNAWWFDYDSRRIAGFTRPRPEVGDYVLCRMESGRIGRFAFVEVEHMHDVHDQYFGTVKFDGYEVPA